MDAGRRILHLGCGIGRDDLATWDVKDFDRVVGLDIDPELIAQARQRYPERSFVCGAGENLPFPSAIFDRVISAVALPYMDIPLAVSEISRVLIARGTVSLSLHLPNFILRELVHHALPHPKATIFRLYVMANGLYFHLSGRTLRWYDKPESFQTRRGITIALQRCGFDHIHFPRAPGIRDSQFRVEARKSEKAVPAPVSQDINAARKVRFTLPRERAS